MNEPQNAPEPAREPIRNPFKAINPPCLWNTHLPPGFEPASDAVSPAIPEREQTGDKNGEQMGNRNREQNTSEQGETAHVHTDASQIEPGNVPSMSTAISPAGGDVSRDLMSVMTRLKAEGRWFGQVALVRDQMMKDAKARIPNKVNRQAWVYSELDRMYPPLNKPVTNSAIAETHSTLTNSAIAENRTGSHSTIVESSPRDDGAIQGLGSIPESWPVLPANASLSAEVAWVQANRLRIVKEQLGKATVVDLGQALSPAPSWAALGWLETSIRSYAKFVDVAAKATSSDDGEATVLRRERLAIDEVKALLGEMEDTASGK